MSCASKGYTSRSEIETFDSYVKQKVLNDEKRLKPQSLIPIYATFNFSIMTLKWYFSTSGLFSKLKRSSNLFDARVAQAPGSFMLADYLKTSYLDSVTAYIKPQLQINVTFYELNTQRQNFINVPYP